MNCRLALTIAAICLTSGELIAEMVYDNQGSVTAGDVYFPHQSDMSNNIIAADDVTFNIATLVNQIQWTGSYLDPTNVTNVLDAENGSDLLPTDDFNISIYEHSQATTGPGSLMQTLALSNLSRTYLADEPTGTGIEIYQYSADIEDFQMNADTTYWISISSNTTGAHKFHWGAIFSPLASGANLHFGAGFPGAKYQFGSQGLVADFQLFGVTGVPEPMSAILFATAMTLCCRRRR